MTRQKLLYRVTYPAVRHMKISKCFNSIDSSLNILIYMSNNFSFWKLAFTDFFYSKTFTFQFNETKVWRKCIQLTQMFNAFSFTVPSFVLQILFSNLHVIKAIYVKKIWRPSLFLLNKWLCVNASWTRSILQLCDKFSLHEMDKSCDRSSWYKTIFKRRG